MGNKSKNLGIGRCKYFGLEDQGLWALLLVVAVVQIGCAFGAGGNGSANQRPALVSAHLQDGTMLAKK